jgi:TP901 family phage tail tape measure protein
VAFRQSEVRMVLGIQSYGTANLTRMRRDLMALSRTADISQANQTRTAERAAAQMERVASTRRSIQGKQASIASRLARAEDARVAGLERVAARRSRLERAQTSFANRAATKRLAIANTEAQIASRGVGGSRMLANKVKEMNISDRLARHADKTVKLRAQEAGFQERIRLNRATQIGLEQQLDKMKVPAPKIAQYRQANANLGNMGDNMRKVVLRLQAADIRAKRLATAMGGVKNQTKMLEAEQRTMNLREQQIIAKLNEELGIRTRQDELLRIQNTQLDGILAREAEIAAELKAITAEEARINTLNKTRLAEIAETKAGLAAETLELREQEAVLARIVGEEMQRSRIADQQAVKSQKLQRREVLGRGVSHVGRTAQFGGLIAMAGFAAAGSAAADFDKKAMLAGTQMRNVTGDFQQAATRGKELKTVILGMMEKFPSDAEEMSDSAYEIFSSMNLVKKGVVDVEGGYRLMTVANKMAVAGQVDLGEATSAMITVLNNFDPELKNVNQTMNQVFSIVRFGQMRLSDFAAAMVPLAPVAKSVGLELTDVGAALASLTIVMKSPQQAAQGLARALELLQLEPFQKGLHEAGIEVTDFETKKMRPLHDIIKDIGNAFPETQTGQRSMVDFLTRISKLSEKTKAGIQGTVQARRALANLVRTEKLYDNILKNVTGNQDEFNEAFKALKDSPGVQWSIFVNQMKAFALTIGQAALPALIKLGSFLVKAAHWIEDLSKKTNGAAIKWMVYGAAIALIGGTVVSMIGSMIALSANMKIATMSMMTMEGAATKASIASSILNKSMMALAGIGIIAIPIVMQLIKGGEPGLWDFLGAAAAGAAGGAMIGSAAGPWGALIGAGIGAIAVPITLEIMTHFQGDDPTGNKGMDAAIAAYGRYRTSLENIGPDQTKVNKEFGLSATAEWLDRAEFIEQWKKSHPEAFAMAPEKKQLTAAEKAWKEYQQYALRFSKEDIDKQNAWWDQMIGTDEDKGDTAIRLAKDRAKIYAQAWENMQNKIDQAVDQLGGIYDKFLDQNKSLFGELGKGPVLTGFMGDIFTDINDMLMQFGQTIPIPMNLINQDLEMQMDNFAKLREGYAALLKKGVPLEVVQQIQAMGLAGLPFVQGLVQAAGPEFQKWLKSVQKGHDDVVKATEIDFDAQLKQWTKYGSDIATKIIDGLSSDAAKAVLKDGFRENVIALFGDTFREEMAKEIADALKELAATEAARKAAEKKAKAAAAAARAARGTPPLKDKQPDVKDVPTPIVVKSPDTIRRRAGLPPLVNGLPPPLTPKPPKPAPRTVINNHGDVNHITASGVTAGNVTKAIHKTQFGRRNQRR